MTLDEGPLQKHLKANYVDIVKRVVPEMYEDAEYRLYGEEEDLQYRVLGNILYTAQNIGSLLESPSEFATDSDWVPFFIPFERVSRVSPYKFEAHALRPLGKTFSDFESVSAFREYLPELLGKMTLNNLSLDFRKGYITNVNTGIGESEVQKELIKHLGWVYLLNQAPTGQTYDLSSVLTSRLCDKLFFGEDLTEEEGVSMVFEWMGHQIQVDDGSLMYSLIFNNFIGSPFNVPAADRETNVHASGIQLISALDTVVRVWVNDDDPDSTFFKDIMDSVFGAGVAPRFQSAGPMSKLLRALSYGFYDLKTVVRDILYLFDTDNCPDEFLGYLGRYLGWKFFTDDPKTWRTQLEQAIYIYKAKGTRQALTTVLEMLVPSDIYDSNAATSGITESWESYFPNLLYYIISTESPLARDPQKFADAMGSWKTLFEGSGLNITLNQHPTDMDLNVRFMVDALLEYLDTKYKFILINGESYRDTEFIKAQEATGNKGTYYHRGTDIAIPPWENNRFYQTAGLQNNLIWEASSILARSVKDFGFGVSSWVASDFATHVLSSISLNETYGVETPSWGVNNGLRFLTSSLVLPPNYGDVIQRGDVESASYFDFWNSKSSEAQIRLSVDSLDFTNPGIYSEADKKLGAGALGAFHEVFSQFTPFHVITRLLLGTEFADSAVYDVSSAIEIIQCLDEKATNFNSSYAASAFPGAFGDAANWSAILPSKKNPYGGRFVPSAGFHVPAAHQASFWSAGGYEGTTADASAFLPVLAPRNSARRRNYRYVFSCWPYSRNGLNQPIGTDFFLASATVHGRGRDVSGFVPKGFNFSSQQYVATSGQYSSVYNKGLTPETTFFEFSAGAFFPARAIPDFDPAASSFGVLRDIFGSHILRALTKIFLRRGVEDSRWLHFDESKLLNYKFGKAIHELHLEYTRKYKRQLRNFVSRTNRYGGGFNVISHAFGPFFFNSKFELSGMMGFSSTQPGMPNKYPDAVSSMFYDWSSIAASPEAKNEVYVTDSGSRHTVTEGILQAGAIGSYQNPFDSYENPLAQYFTNGMMLSGIEFVGGPANSFVVWNRPGSLTNIDQGGPSGLTFVNRSTDTDYTKSVRLRHSLDGNRNYAVNGDFKFPPVGIYENDMSLSAVAGWGMADRFRTSSISNGGNEFAVAKNDGPNEDVATVSSIMWSGLSVSSHNSFYFTTSSNANGNIGKVGNIGSRFRPSIYTNVTPGAPDTPRNLRNLTPSGSYSLTFDFSANHENGNVGLTLVNTTKGKVWAGGPSWTDTTSDLSGYDYVTPALVSGSDGLHQSSFDADSWWTLSAGVTISPAFDKNDTYQLWVTPFKALTAGLLRSYVRDIKMVEVDNQIAAPVMNGLVANRLFAEHSYKIITKAKSALIGTGTRGNEKLFIRVVTDPKPFVGDGWNSFAKSWCYNWEKSFWEETDSSQRDQWHAIEVSSIGVNTDEAIFHTFNHRTPLRYDARSYLGSMEGYFTSAGPVHDSNTIYYIEIAKPLNTGAMRGVTLLSTEMVDMNYNPYLQDYTQKDVEDIFNWFDNKLSRGNISRDSRDSSGTFCTSGGSRSEYLEWFGGSNSALDGVYGFIDK